MTGRAARPKFQSTPPRGRRPKMTWCRLLLRSFNPRLRVGGDSGTIRIGARKSSFQSTPPRGRRLFCRVVAVIGDAVSIHASAWEATGRPPSLATRANSFNPRLRVGGDHAQICRAVIIAPFQSTPPRGRRREYTDLFYDVDQFQSTPPRGRRLAIAAIRFLMTGFNPRLRVGGDVFLVDLFMPHLSFNPRLRVGGDVRVERVRDISEEVSIHASAWEATFSG